MGILWGDGASGCVDVGHLGVMEGYSGFVLKGEEGSKVRGWLNRVHGAQGIEAESPQESRRATRTCSGKPDPT